MYSILPRILCVDDEPHVLDGMARNLRRHFEVTVAPGGEAGLSKLAHEGPFAVVISDQRMPGMDGVTFLSKVRELSPDTVRILLTGYADTNAAMGAVNRGAVFRFLTKPIELPELHQTLIEAVEHHRTTASERVVLERTLHGSIKAITDTLALVDPAGYARALRTREIVSTIAERVSAPDTWLIEIAAMLSQVASPALGTDGEKRSGQMLTQMESSTVDRLAKIAEDVIVNIPRMGEIRTMLESRDLHYDGSAGRHDDPRELAIPLGARILKIALDLDTLEVGGASRPEAVDVLRSRDGRYDRELLDTLAWSGGPSLAAQSEVAVPAAASAAPAPKAPPPPPKLFEIELRKVQPGMMLDEDVCTVAGRVLIGRGEEATRDSIDQVKKTLNFEALRQIVRVRPPKATAADEAFSQQGHYRFMG